MEKRETEQTKLSFEQIREIIDNRIALMEESGESGSEEDRAKAHGESDEEEKGIINKVKRLFRFKGKR